MAGQVRKMIDTLAEKRSGGNEVLMKTTMTKLILKGINVKKYDASSEDDATVIAKIKDVANEWGITL